MSKRQFGTIRKLGSGRWQARYRDDGGRLIAAPDTFATKADAARFLSVVEADMARGRYLDPRAGRVTFEEWSADWLARPGKRASSTTRDRHALAAFMPALGGLALSAVTPAHVQGAVDARAREAAPATVARDFSALRALLNAAVDADLIARSPARRVSLPRVLSPEHVTLDPDDLARLVAALPPHYATVVMVGAVLGLRWGEAVGLRVRDIDFTRGTVTVAQTIEEVAGHLRIVAEAKTKGSVRTLAAPVFVLNELARHLAEYRGAPRADSDELVFVGPRGGVLRRRFGERILQPAVERAGLPAGLTFHGLRHSAVTAMADAGVPYNVTQSRAGHATARMTMELYSHRTTAADRAAADSLQTHFGPAFSGGSGTGVARKAVTGTQTDE